MLIPLTDWDARHFAKPHSRRTLQGWAREGKIQPAPVKVGKEWLVEENARYVNNSQQIRLANKAREFVNGDNVGHNSYMDETVMRILNGS